MILSTPLFVVNSATDAEFVIRKNFKQSSGLQCEGKRDVWRDRQGHEQGYCPDLRAYKFEGRRLTSGGLGQFSVLSDGP